MDREKQIKKEIRETENNYKNNSYTIKKITFRGGIVIDIKKITSGKEEVLSIGELKKWLVSNGYKDAFDDYYKIKSRVS